MSLYTNQMLANHKKVARYPKTLAEEKRGRDRGGVKGGGKEREREGGRGERERKREGGRGERERKREGGG